MENCQSLTVSIENFSVQETLECGQCFRFQKIDAATFAVTACHRQLYLRQASGNSIIFYTSQQDFEAVWKDYFDLTRNYAQLKEVISKDDPVLTTAIQYAPGLRLLNQEFFECLISFIISQNNHIPRIKGMIEKLSSAYGTKISAQCYAFPTLQQLCNVTEDDYRKLGAGFRGKYMEDAVRKLCSGTIDEESFGQMETPQLREKLMEIYGVGPKVADCVMLFSLKRYEVFPSDVWVRRILSELYCDGRPCSLKEIQELAHEKFGMNAGFAQQYLFHYARQMKIGKTKEGRKRKSK